MRYLITGAGGFVGGAATRAAIAAGDEVHAFIRDPRQEAALVEAGARVFVGSLGAPKSIAEAAASCDVVVHAAAATDHRASQQLLGWVNVAGTANVLRAALHAGVGRVVYLSCGDVTLHDGPRLGWDEDKGLSGAPMNDHAASKLEAEEMVIGAGDERLETSVLRPAMVWGPGDRTHLPVLAGEVLRGGVRLPGDGNNLISAIYVDNLVDAVLLAAEGEDAPGAVYNVADEELALAGEFYTSMAEALGGRLTSTGSYRLSYAKAWLRKRSGAEGHWPTDIVRRGQTTSLDQQRARTRLGYMPRVSHGEGFERLKAWVDDEGGAEAIHDKARPTPTVDSIADQLEMAER